MKFQQGEIPVGQILIIGAVIIPLVLMLIMYKSELAMYLMENTAEVMIQSEK